MPFKKYFIFLILIVLPFFGAGCLQFNSSQSANNGGFFKSVNAGNDWLQKSNLLSVGAPRSFASADVISIVQDPSDRLALYAGTAQNGLLYSYDAGESWQQARYIATGRVSAVAVDPQEKCRIYAGASSRILKSDDCNRSFSEIFRGESEITSLIINPSASNIIYAGTATGFLLKSVDAGKTWTPLKNFNGRIVDVVLDPKENNTLYAAVLRRGVWKSENAGQDWLDLSKGFKSLSGALEMKKLVISRVSSQTLILASKYGLIRTSDGGDVWEPIKLLTPAGKFDIYSLAIDPKNNDKIYYSTASLFYKTQNGGATWETKKPPSSRAATALLVDAADSNVILVGVTKLAQ